MFKVVPVIGAANIGASIFLPNNSIEVLGLETLCITLILIFIFSKPFLLFINEAPLPFPPIPGTSPEQATPLHTLQTLQLPLKFSLAIFSTSLKFIIILPLYKLFCKIIVYFLRNSFYVFELFHAFQLPHSVLLFHILYEL